MQNLTSSIQKLLDREAIWECLLRYTRGVDRLDRELMLSAFHSSATIAQGSFRGTREQLADWVLTHHRDNQQLTQHLISNFHCEIDGDVAHTETYVLYYGLNTSPANTDAFAVGRYIDRLERHASNWLIGDRVCTTEGTTDFVKNGLLEQFASAPGSLSCPTRDKTDPSYIRPLIIAQQ